jgi:mannose-1-phosphate guanylyltransferase
MACGFGADPLREVLGDGGRRGPRIRYVEEDEPLGTAGPLRLAADEGLLAERFLMLNGDLLSELDLTALVRGHQERGAVATLALSPVEDPRAYGLVRRAGGPSAPGAVPASEEGEVLEFIEKPDPAQIDTDEVSAGAYVLERSLIDSIPPGTMMSIEHEVFPRLVGRGLYGHRLEGYWMDIGTPERYLQASWDILEGRVRTAVGTRLDGPGLLIDDGVEVDPSARLSPPALLQAEVAVGAGAEVGPRAVIGSRSEIGEGARVAGSVVLSDCRIGADASVHDAILAPGVEVGEGARIEAGAVVGEGAQIEDGAVIEGAARLDPGQVAS